MKKIIKERVNLDHFVWIYPTACKNVLDDHSNIYQSFMKSITLYDLEYLVSQKLNWCWNFVSGCEGNFLTMSDTKLLSGRNCFTKRT